MPHSHLLPTCLRRISSVDPSPDQLNSSAGTVPDNPLLAERADALLVTIGRPKFAQKGVPLPLLHLPHDVVSESAAFSGQYGVDQLACQLLQQPEFASNCAVKSEAFPIIAV